VTFQKTKVVRFVLIAAAAMVWSMPVGVDGQAAKAPAPAASKRAIPRLADGHPICRDVRPRDADARRASAGSPLVMTTSRRRKLERQAAPRADQLGRADRRQPRGAARGGDGSAGPAGNVGGYNSFWIDADRGTR
jgi:hypothetical protein